MGSAAFVSKSEVLRCFKNITGQSPFEYLKNYRLRNAAYMIKNTSDSINAICGLCGFDDHSYFQKPLKKPTGAVPEILESRIYGTISHRFIRLPCRHYIFLFIGLQ
ncbi:helix-turn-helix transcriptional regulator [Ruminococcus bicirculans (ex Wegman et al. 2014)]|uniref:helix-turn-helix transcriptional regulator n=1 Tax=Ruminococcus bicirculans (ex Wegman et al. 2014) TaxID=1160721 RepID=UPI003461CE08